MTENYFTHLHWDAIEVHKHGSNFNQSEESVALIRVWFPGLYYIGSSECSGTTVGQHYTRRKFKDLLLLTELLFITSTGSDWTLRSCPVHYWGWLPWAQWKHMADRETTLNHSLTSQKFLWNAGIYLLKHIFELYSSHVYFIRILGRVQFDVPCVSIWNEPGSLCQTWIQFWWISLH